jgi:general secretion pathway protein K
VLWFCALLALTAGRFLNASRTDALLVRQRTDLARARAAADAGVTLALIGLAGAAPDGPWRFDGSTRTVRFGDAAVVVAIQDELGLIDVNSVSAEVLAGLFRATGASAPDSLAAAEAIVRWRDPSIGPRRQAATPDDLIRLPGVPRRLMERAAAFLTVRSGAAGIDPVTAPLTVLRSVPDTPQWLADTMNAARSEATVLPGTLPLLNDPGGLGPPPHRFAIVRAEGRIASGARFVREAEVELRPDAESAYRILSWRQAPGGLAEY